MMIKLTRVTNRLGKATEPVWLNPKHIVSLMPDPEFGIASTQINLSNDKVVMVEEHAAVVARIINDPELQFIDGTQS